jgi:hypothetical protein
VLRGAAGEDLAEPGLDPLEVLVPCGKDAGLDEHVAHVVQGGGLGLLVEQGVGELPVMGCPGQLGQEPAAGLPGEPAGDRSRADCVAEGGQDGWASVACSCWFIAHRAQGRRRGVVSVPLQAAQANSGGWPAHGPQTLLPPGPAARRTWCWPQRGQFAGLARICWQQAPQTGPIGHHAITGRAWPHDRHSCAGQVRQIMQTGGPSRVSQRPCCPQAVQVARGLAAQRSQRSGWPAAARSRTGRSRPHPPHRRSGGPQQLRPAGPSGRSA